MDPLFDCDECPIVTYKTMDDIYDLLSITLFWTCSVTLYFMDPFISCQYVVKMFEVELCCGGRERESQVV